MNKFNVKLSDLDPEIKTIIDQEYKRQEEGIELIASENYTSPAVMEAQGSVLTNKYAEGYPAKRYYGGCHVVDKSENLAIDRLKKLFGADYANVQPHSGSQANMAVYIAALKPGDKVLGMDLAQGGHLTHGSPVNFSGKLYDIASYGLDEKTERIDYDQVASIAKAEKPKMIIAGASAYSRTIDFQAFKDIADSVGAYLMVDMAHIAGLIAAGEHPSPIGIADFITSTTHKTLRGPRGGLILAKEEWAKKINSSIFPGIQGGPLEHVIAAKAVSFLEALTDNFKTYQKQVVVNAKAMADEFLSNGVELVSGGTDNHLMTIKTDYFDLSGKEGEAILEKIDITTNKNMIPGDKRSPFVTSGIRLGTPAMTTRGLDENHAKTVAKWIIEALKSKGDEATLAKIKTEVIALCNQFPVYPR